MGDGFTVLDDVGNDVLAEVAAGIRVGRIALQAVDQEFRVEDIDAHRGESEIGIAWDTRRIGRLLDEVDDLVLVVDMHDAEADGFHARHFKAADRDLGARIDVLLQHPFIVHLVDVVAGEDDHVFRAIGLDDVDVLVDGIGRTFVPLRFGNAL